MRVARLPALVFALCLTGCGETPPTDAEAKKAIEAMRPAEYAEFMKVAKVRVQGGKSGEEAGSPTYAMELEADLEYTVDGQRVAAELHDATWNEGNPAEGGVKFRKGQQKTVTGTLRFKKSAKGWEAAPEADLWKK